MLNTQTSVQYSTFGSVLKNKEVNKKKWFVGIIGVVVTALVVAAVLFLQQSDHPLTYGQSGPSHNGVVRAVTSKNQVSAQEEVMGQTWKKMISGEEEEAINAKDLQEVKDNIDEVGATVETVVNEVKETVDGVANTINTIKDIVETVQGTIETIQAGPFEANAEVSTKETVNAKDLQEVKDNIDEVGATVETVVNEVKETVDGVANTINTIKDIVETVQGTIETIQAGPFEANAEVSTKEEVNAKDLQEVKDNIDEVGATVETVVNEVKETVDGVANTINTIKDIVETVQGTIETIQAGPFENAQAQQ